MRVLLAEKVAGVIISPTDENSVAYKPLIKSGTPVVLLDRRLRHIDADTVIVDNIQGAYDAVDHLIRLGHRRIELIGGPMRITTARERQGGYTKALRDHGMTPARAPIRAGDFCQESAS